MVLLPVLHGTVCPHAQNLPIFTAALVLHHQHHPYVVVNTAEKGRVWARGYPWH